MEKRVHQTRKKIDGVSELFTLDAGHDEIRASGRSKQTVRDNEELALNARDRRVTRIGRGFGDGRVVCRSVICPLDADRADPVSAADDGRSDSRQPGHRAALSS
jgi:hypothetical protein